MNGVAERLIQATRNLRLRVVVLLDRLPSIEPSASLLGIG
jgi:hypothetical protein